MRNQYMAKVLVHNKVVSEDQVKAHWGEISDSMDIGQVLVRAGILKQSMYDKVLAFVKNLEAKNAKPAEKPVEKPAAPASAAAPAHSAATSSASSHSASTPVRPAPAVSAAPAPQPAEEPAIKTKKRRPKNFRRSSPLLPAKAKPSKLPMFCTRLRRLQKSSPMPASLTSRTFTFTPTARLPCVSRVCFLSRPKRCSKRRT